MVTVATRIEPQEVAKLRELAADCGISVCAYLRDLIRLELGRARRIDELEAPANKKGMNGDSAAYDIAV
ncbi:MAG: ribbon-helix-helix protein, CopG family [Gammaproteobacteria bacterium]|nr:ribbon-helix-helix protein, CopG family [Gammaproteobacteria bacterium]